MRKIFKVFIILGICLLLSGGSVFTVVLAKNGWDINALSNVEYISEERLESALLIDEIQVKTYNGDIRVQECDGADIEIDYYTAMNKKGKVLTEFDITLEGGVLTVKEVPKKRIFSIYTSSPDVVIKIPTLEKTALKLVSNTGDITFKNGSDLLLSSLSVKTDTGDVTVARRINCDGDIKFITDTGDVKLSADVVCGANVKFETDTGDITLNKELKAAALNIKTDTGDIITKGCVWADSIAINTDTGNVKLIVTGAKEDYSYIFNSDTGDSNVLSFANIGAEKSIAITTDTGDVKLYFAD